MTCSNRPKHPGHHSLPVTCHESVIRLLTLIVVCQKSDNRFSHMEQTNEMSSCRILYKVEYCIHFALCCVHVGLPIAVYIKQECTR